MVCFLQSIKDKDFHSFISVDTSISFNVQFGTEHIDVDGNEFMVS